MVLSGMSMGTGEASRMFVFGVQRRKFTQRFSCLLLVSKFFLIMKCQRSFKAGGGGGAAERLTSVIARQRLQRKLTRAVFPRDRPHPQASGTENLKSLDLVLPL